jgi:hypothetical protein
MIRSPRSLPLIALALVVLTACAPRQATDLPQDVVLRAQPTPATAGGSLTLVLENGSGEQVGYNLCASSLDRRVAEEWQPVPSDRVCTMELRILEPGGEADFTLDLPTDLPTGEYRATTDVAWMERGGRVSVSTQPFRIGG